MVDMIEAREQLGWAINQLLAGRPAPASKTLLSRAAVRNLDTALVLLLERLGENERYADAADLAAVAAALALEQHGATVLQRVLDEIAEDVRERAHFWAALESW